ncbi:hypothetical protein GH714_036537 [Hevea brasiliensis]|uniref:Uncharacterized protein n=1 Tax=Hevea brasiliensis TaxID=3981 RepID=A0A6A6KN10_HEVBR|nr:hypothetical protein GH714_036537 [Hevea brasiliensis]
MDTTAAADATNTTTATVQTCDQKSSDELLRKFAELGEDETAAEAKMRKEARLGIRNIQHHTWRKTLEGASKVFLEKHYNRHRRLISEVV